MTKIKLTTQAKKEFKSYFNSLITHYYNVSLGEYMYCKFVGVPNMAFLACSKEYRGQLEHDANEFAQEVIRRYKKGEIKYKSPLIK